MRTRKAKGLTKITQILVIAQVRFQPGSSGYDANPLPIMPGCPQSSQGQGAQHGYDLSLRNGNLGYQPYSVKRCSPRRPGPSLSPSVPLGPHREEAGHGVPASHHCHPPSRPLSLPPGLSHALCFLRMSIGPWALHVASCLPALAHMLPSAWNTLTCTARVANSIVLQSQLKCHLLQGALPDFSPPTSLTLLGHYPLTIIMALLVFPWSPQGCKSCLALSSTAPRKGKL